MAQIEVSVLRYCQLAEKLELVLTSIRARHWVSLGAWVTLLLLGVDPFWQAIIQYNGKLVSTGHNDSSILTSRQLSVGDWNHESPADPEVDYHGYDNGG